MLLHSKLLSTWGRAIPSTKAGWTENRLSSPGEKDLRGWWIRGWTWPSNVHLQPRNPNMSWAASCEAWPVCPERWFCLSALVRTLTWRNTSSSEDSNITETVPGWSKSRGGTQSHQRAGESCLGQQTERVVVVQPGKEKSLRGLRAAS